MEKVWVITAEILVNAGDLPSGNTNAFVNAATWADCSSTAEEKVAECLKSYQWQLVGIEDTHPFDDSRSYGDEMLEIVDQVRADPRACIIGRAFSYKPE
jgi:hypothetical protein